MEDDEGDDENEHNAAIAMLRLIIVLVVSSYTVDDNLISACQVCQSPAFCKHCTVRCCFSCSVPPSGKFGENTAGRSEDSMYGGIN